MSEDRGLEDYVENELALHIGLPAIIGVTLTTRWRARRAVVADTATDVAGVSVDELGERVRDNEAYSDIFLTAMARTGEVSDPDYGVTLGRLLAAGFDDANVDEVGYTVKALTLLEPVELRALFLGFSFHKPAVPGGLDDYQAADPVEATAYSLNQVETAAAADRLGVTAATAEVIFNNLATAGWVETDYVAIMRSSDDKQAQGSSPTTFARQMVQFVYPGLQPL